MKRFVKNILFAIILVITIASFAAILVWLNVEYPQIGLIVLILIVISYVLYKLQKNKADSKLNRLVKRFWELVKEI